MKYQKLKQIISSNWFIGDIAIKIYANDYNKKMLRFVNEVSNIDPILNIGDFYDKMQSIPASIHNSNYTYKRIFSENTVYGYAYQLMRYAKIENESMLYLPLVQHGIPYGDDLDYGSINRNSSYIFQGKASQIKWERMKNHREAYYIGPFIHYCRPIYSSEFMKQLKNKYGKIQLIFLPHTIEFSQPIDEIEKNIDKSIDHRSQFDTIFVCCYYADITPKLINIDLNRKGIKVVSCGFKLDRNFVGRLRSLLELADSVVFPDFSTSIGFAYYLNKKIVCKIQDDDLNLATKRFGTEKNKLLNFKRAFGSDKSNSYAAYDFINKYWGLDQIKTSQEIREIYYQNKKQLIRNWGF